MNIQDRAMMIVAEGIDRYNNDPFFGKYVGFPKIHFNLKGHTAGWATSKEIALNFDIMTDKRNINALHDTTIHELAHTIDAHLNGRSDHGERWQKIMLILGAEPERCHNYKTKAARKTKKFAYQCACEGITKFGTVRHKREQKSPNYYHCTTCGQHYYFLGEIK